MNAVRVTKTAVIWMTIVYAICALGVALLPGLAESVMRSVFHGLAVTSSPKITFSTTVIGLIYLDIFTAISAYIFAAIYNKVK